MKKIVQGGFLFVLFGTACADSSSMIPSIALVLTGVSIMGAGLCIQQQKQ